MICWLCFNMIKPIELITKVWLQLSSNNNLYHDQWVSDTILLILNCKIFNNQPVEGIRQHPLALDKLTLQYDISHDITHAISHEIRMIQTNIHVTN